MMEGGKYWTIKMESSDMLGDLERSLPDLEKGGCRMDRNMASVEETAEYAFFGVALPR